MAINIKINNSEIGEAIEIMNGGVVCGQQDYDIQIEKIKAKKALKIMNNWTDLQVNDFVNILHSLISEADKNSNEYARIQRTVTEIEKSPTKVRDILKKYLPDLMVGTFSNVISSYFTQR